jgi:peptidoglycan/LPS O-acetylase OafA/YrhL
MDNDTAHKRWIPGLDGLRAFALLCVLVHHFNVEAVGQWALGNVGVAVFFCLSGFLVYATLDNDKQRYGAISYERYLRRRVLRIWPLYFFVIAVALLATWLWTDQTITAPSVMPLFLFSLNFQLAHWQEWPFYAGLAPLWSIAVEQQFYILAPLLYVLINSRFQVVGVVVLVVLANLLRAWVALNETHVGNGGLYYLSYTYLDVFVAGALLAHWHARKTIPALIKTGVSYVRDTVYLLLTLCLLVAVIRWWGLSIFQAYNHYTLIPYMLLPVVTMLILNMVVLGDRFGLTQLLSLKPIRALGIWSFAGYVVHLPIFYLMIHYVLPKDALGHVHNGLGANVMLMGLVVVVAAALHKAVEQPFLNMKYRLATPPSGSGITRRDIPWVSFMVVGLVTCGIFFSYLRING